MAVTQEQVQWQLDKGYNIFCATCVHHHDGIVKGLYSCIQSASSCAGPLRGKSFPDYLGPIPRDRFREICLMCGTPDLNQKVLTNGQHTFSLCKTHRRVLMVLPGNYVTQEPITVPVSGRK